MFILPVHAQIYQWTDAHGTTHFSDEPQKGAQSIKLHVTQTYDSTPVNDIQTTSTPKSEANQMEIVQPKDKATIRNPQGSLTLILELSPSLNKEEKLQVLLDGAIITPLQTTTQFKLDQIKRGAHSIVVHRLNKQGQSISKTKVLRFYMMPPKMSNLSFSP